MTNRLAILLGLILLALIAADIFLREASGLLYLARKFLNLLNYIAFWR